MKKNNIHYLILCTMLLSLVTHRVLGQDLGNLKNYTPKNLLKGKGVTIGGMIGANHTYYQATGIPNRAVPLNFLYSGNLNVDILGKIKMPVTFSFSNQNINFTNPFDKQYRFAQPFNRLVLKPTYKGLTLHLGTAALTFSPYTLAGHRFDGVGVEYKPKKLPFYVGVMSGNLQRAVRIDSSYETRNNRPSYKRTGWGVQTGFKIKQDKLEFIFFTAVDKLNSLPYLLDAQNILPLANAVASVKAEKTLWRKLQIGGEIAYSGITTDTRADTRVGDKAFMGNFFGTITPLTTTDYLKAIKGTINYQGKTFTTGVDYSRVDPGYRTLGAYFFNSDLQTLAAKGATQLMQGKLTLSGNVGVQEDNVWKQKPKTLRRVVGGANVAFMPTEKISITTNYSNFSSYSNLLSRYEYLTQATPYNYLDTLNYRQINQNSQTSVAWQLPTASEKNQQSLNLSALIQRGGDEQGTQRSSNNLANYSVDYALNLDEPKLNFTTSFLLSQLTLANEPTTQWGPAIGLQKGFFNNQLNSNTQFIFTKSNSLSVNETITNARLGLQYALKQKHQLKFDAILLRRNAKTTERVIPNFHELTLTLGYVYNFTVLDAKIK